MLRFFPSRVMSNQPYRFKTKTGIQAELRRIQRPQDIDQARAKDILVTAFTTEWKKYLQPSDIRADFKTWEDVEAFYADYFTHELKTFAHGHLHDWVEVYVEGSLAGWATFERECENAVYMNLLAVHPKYQGQSLGAHLVNSLIELAVIPDLSAVHILLRRKNSGGRCFYESLGFYSDPTYVKTDNHVPIELLEPMTWRNPKLQLIHTPQDTYCGFRPGFLIGQPF